MSLFDDLKNMFTKIFSEVKDDAIVKNAPDSSSTPLAKSASSPLKPNTETNPTSNLRSPVRGDPLLMTDKLAAQPNGLLMETNANIVPMDASKKEGRRSIYNNREAIQGLPTMGSASCLGQMQQEYREANWMMRRQRFDQAPCSCSDKKSSTNTSPVTPATKTNEELFKREADVLRMAVNNRNMRQSNRMPSTRLETVEMTTKASPAAGSPLVSTASKDQMTPMQSIYASKNGLGNVSKSPKNMVTDNNQSRSVAVAQSQQFVQQKNCTEGYDFAFSPIIPE